MKGSPQGASNLRNVFCAHYADCLDMAAKAGWDDWTCAQCPLKDVLANKPGASAFANDRRGR